MKRVIILCAGILALVSCTATKSNDSARASRRAIKAEETRLAVERLVNSGSYLIKMNRLYSGRISNVYLIPENNFILLDKGNLRMKLGYMGRQYDFRGIAAINMSATAESYEVVRNTGKGRYDVRIKASQAGEPFDIYISIHDSGSASASVNNPRIQMVNYSGKLVFPSTVP
jgi:hypothetical protein